MGAGVDDWDLVNLLFPNSRCDSEIVWLVSSYVQYVWETVHVENSEVKFDRFFGYLTFKYKMHQATSCEQQQKQQKRQQKNNNNNNNNNNNKNNNKNSNNNNNINTTQHNTT